MKLLGMLYLAQAEGHADNFLQIARDLHKRNRGGDEIGAFLFAWKAIHAAEREGNSSVIRKAESLIRRIAG